LHATLPFCPSSSDFLKYEGRLLDDDDGSIDARSAVLHELVAVKLDVV